MSFTTFKRNNTIKLFKEIRKTKERTTKVRQQTQGAQKGTRESRGKNQTKRNKCKDIRKIKHMTVNLDL